MIAAVEAPAPVGAEISKSERRNPSKNVPSSKSSVYSVHEESLFLN